jgi:hypothetical protein
MLAETAKASSYSQKSKFKSRVMVPVKGQCQGFRPRAKVRLSITSTVRVMVKAGLLVIDSDVFRYGVSLEMREEGA